MGQLDTSRPQPLSIDELELRMLRQQVRQLGQELAQRDATIDDLLGLLRVMVRPDAGAQPR